ncbi:putative ornithine cyclodeaminase [Podospora conica]|nr:putative ornithine cyclodeaminase [Schizothecium conicum]
MTLSVLSDDQIRSLLENLTADELAEFQQELRNALHEYSKSTQTNHVDDGQQLERTSVHSKETGATTLFMPSSSSAGNGVKVITLTPPNGDPSKPVIPPTGAITLFAPSGEAAGILHAGTITAFRTALASLCLVSKRSHVSTLTVFGSGGQAYWHIRLALMLRGATIRQVHIVNRQLSGHCSALVDRLRGVPASTQAREGWTDCRFDVLTPEHDDYERLLEKQVLAADVIFCCTPATAPLFEGGWLTTHEARLKGRLVVAIGSYRPDMKELPGEIIRQAVKTHHEGRRWIHHKHAREGGAVVVDTIEGALTESGEVIDAGLGPEQLIELGELVMLANLAAEENAVAGDSEVQSPASETPSVGSDLSGGMKDLDVSDGHPSAMSSVFGSGGLFHIHHRRPSSAGSDGSRKKDKRDPMALWLAKGNVIYKSVGMGAMDLSVGMHLIKFAREKEVGSHIEF